MANKFEGLFGSPQTTTQGEVKNTFEGLFGASPQTQEEPVLPGTTERYNDVQKAAMQELLQIENRIVENLKEQEQVGAPSGLRRVIDALFLPKAEREKKAGTNATQKELQAELKNLQIAEEAYREFTVQPSENKNFFLAVAEGFTDRFKEGKLIPFIGSLESFDEIRKVTTAVEKETRGELITPVEKSLIAKYRAKNLPVDKGLGYMVGATISELPTYASEFLLTGGVFTAIKKGVVKTLEKTALKELNKRVAGIVAHTIGTVVAGGAQSLVNVPQIAEKTAEYMIPNADLLSGPYGQEIFGQVEKNGDDFKTALTKSIGVNAVEYITERVGVLIDKPLTWFGNATIAKFFAKRGITASSKAFDFIKKGIAWDGIIGEVFEEELAELAHAPIEGREYKAPWTPEGFERFMVETFSIGAFGGIGRITDMAMRQVPNQRPQEVLDITPEAPAKVSGIQEEVVPTKLYQDLEESLPKDVVQEAQQDWQTTFQPEVQKLEEELQTLDVRLSQATPEEQDTITDQLNTVIDRLSAIEDEFKEKWEAKSKTSLTREVADAERLLQEEYEQTGEKSDKAMGEMMFEIEGAEAGQRIFVRDAEGNMTGVMGQESTFPKWIPEELRSKDLFNEVFAPIISLGTIKYPTGRFSTRQRALVDAFLDELDKRTGVDTRKIREGILNVYGKAAGRKVEAISRERAPRDEGEPRAEEKPSEKKVLRPAVTIQRKGVEKVTRGSNSIPKEFIPRAVAWKRWLNQPIAAKDSWGSPHWQIVGSTEDAPEQVKKLNVDFQKKDIAFSDITPDNVSEAQFIGAAKVNKIDVVVLQTPQGRLALNKDILAPVAKLYPNSRAFAKEPNSPVIFREGNKDVALVIGIRLISEAEIKDFQPIGEVREETPPSEEPKKVLIPITKPRVKEEPSIEQRPEKATPALDFKVGEKVEIFGKTGKSRGTGVVSKVEDKSLIIKDDFSGLPIRYGLDFEFRKVGAETPIGKKVAAEVTRPRVEKTATEIQIGEKTLALWKKYIKDEGDFVSVLVDLRTGKPAELERGEFISTEDPNYARIGLSPDEVQALEGDKELIRQLLQRKIDQAREQKALPEPEVPPGIASPGGARIGDFENQLELKPVKVKDPQYDQVTIDRAQGRAFTDERPNRDALIKGSKYEEVVFESPITTNGSSHYPNSKNYFAHARGDEVVEGGKRVWREQEIQSDLLQKDRLAGFADRESVDFALSEGERLTGRTDIPAGEAKKMITDSRVAERQQELQQLTPFTNDRFGERIMRERIKEKAKQGYEKYRLPTGETIGKIEGFELREWITPQGLVVEPRDLKVGMEVIENLPHETGDSWIITDILGEGRFKAVTKDTFERGGNPKLSLEENIKVANKTGEGETFDLTGKSNPQYRRYENWGKFLRNKYGGKQVTDPQGNSWWEIDLLPEYAFGVFKGITTEQRGIVRGFARKLANLEITWKAFTDRLKQVFPYVDPIIMEDIGDQSRIFQEQLNVSVEGKVIDIEEYVVGRLRDELPERAQAPSGIASAGGDAIGAFERQHTLATGEEGMKIYERVKALIQKYAKSIGQDYLPRGAAGVYYEDTTNIRIKGLNNLSVAAHEITHFLDFAYKISDRVQGIRGYSTDGKPLYDKDTAKLRKEMTDLYEQYYPGGKRTHKLKKRMIEGFATLLQKYTEAPKTISAQFPALYAEFLQKGGTYYEPIMGEILADLKAIVVEYQGLSALDKIGSRIVNGEVNVEKGSFLNFFDRVKTELADNLYPIEKLAKKLGLTFSRNDPSLWARQYNAVSALIMQNIRGKRGYWGWRDANLVKLQDYNWRTIISGLEAEKAVNDFGSYLVARREYFIFQEMKELKTGKEYEELASIVKNDGFTEAEVTEVYLQNQERFAEYEKMFDALTQEDLNFLSDPSIALITSEEKSRLQEQKGYASFKRLFYDEITGEEQGPSSIRVGKTKISSLLRRKGSQKPIINPLFSALRNHAEITRKGLKQAVYNRIVALTPQLPDLLQRLPLKVVPDLQGRFIYPQEKDPHIIMGRTASGKRVPVLVDELIKRTVDETLNYQNIGTFEMLLSGASRLFTKGTTGLFAPFSVTNYTVDQITGWAQTRNKYVPVFSALKALSGGLNPNNPDHVFALEYLVSGGERQTIIHWQDMSPNELFSKISEERKGLLKVFDLLEKGQDILAIPATYSEIATRMSEYIKSRKSGKPSIVALEEAGRVTAPFHHIGRWGGGKFGQTWVRSIPFFNPSIQVLSQALETLETPAGRQRYAFVTLAVTAASISSLGLLFATGSDDQKKLYLDIHPDELSKYIWLPNPNGKSLIKIRMPDQMAVFATLINMTIMQAMVGAKYSAGEYVAAGTSWLPTQFNPTDPVQAFMTWVPQLIKPGFLTIANVRDFPKVMPLETQSQTSKLPGLRVTETTSPVAKTIGGALNISPIKIDYLVEGYFGRVSRLFTGKFGTFNPLSGMKREYYFTSGRRLQRYYDMREENRQQFSAMDKREKEFSPEQRTDIMRLKGRIKVVDDLLDSYRDIDLDAEPERASDLRSRIIDQLDQL